MPDTNLPPSYYPEHDDSPGIVGNAAGAAIVGGGAYTGGLIASHMYTGKSLDGSILDAQRAHDHARLTLSSKEKELIGQSTKNQRLHKNFTDANTQVTQLEAAHAKDVAGHWNGKIGANGMVYSNGVTHIDRAHLELGRLDAETAHLRSMPSTDPARQWQIDYNESKAARIKKVMGDNKKFKTNPFGDRHLNEQLTEHNSQFLKGRPRPASHAEFMKQNKTALDTAGFHGLNETATGMPQLTAHAESVRNGTKASLERLNTARTKAETATTNWDAVRGPALKNEIAAEKDAQAALHHLQATKKISEGKGIASHLARPITMFREASTARKAGIIGGTVAVGVIAYQGAKAVLRPDKPSYFDRERMRREMAADQVSMGATIY